MRYRSTRDTAAEPTLLSFQDTVMTGLAHDGGLFVPERVPTLPEGFLRDWASLSYEELCFNILRRYIAAVEMPDDDLRQLIARAYSTFTHPERTPVRRLADKHYILELFHGPTLAFKDVALQLLGHLFAYFLAKQPGKHMTVVGATSGDTGGAAIYGLRGHDNIDVFILHPHNRIAPIQQAQMTSILDANVHNVAVEGTFDDCQDLVKAIFGSADMRAFNLGAVNSINWARILAQTVYYFSAFFAVCRSEGWDPSCAPQMDFIVPTGNFGDILAGYYAKRMGLPLGRLCIATNANDILTRFFESGVYERRGVVETRSPAMDIQVSSNFERYLFHLSNGDAAMVKQWMMDLKLRGSFAIPKDMLETAKCDFMAARASDEMVVAAIQSVYGETGYTLDPHTAVGVHVASSLSSVRVTLATAHPAKFLGTVYDALMPGQSDVERRVLGEGTSPVCPIPEVFHGLMDRPTRCANLKNDLAALKSFIAQHTQK